MLLVARRMSPIEIAAVLLGLVNVTLVVRRSVWNYPFGIAMVVLYADIFFDAKLYSDALLQLFFLAVQFYGWWNWCGRKLLSTYSVQEACTIVETTWRLH